MSSMLALMGGGNGRIVSLPHGFADVGNLAYNGPRAQVLSGATTANTLRQLLSVTGRCRLLLLAIRCEDTTARDVRVRVTGDGIGIFDQTANAVADTNHRLVVGAASVVSTAVSGLSQPLDFYKSLLIEFSSSLGETDKLRLTYAYEVRQ